MFESPMGHQMKTPDAIARGVLIYLIFPCALILCQRLFSLLFSYDFPDKRVSIEFAAAVIPGLCACIYLIVDFLYVLLIQ